MGQAWIDFDSPDLAARIERLGDDERDELPFGVIHLDRDGIVLFYSKTAQSGNPDRLIGENFYTHTRRMHGDAFRGRIMRAQEEGAVDLEIGWLGDYSDPKRELRVRVQSARDGGVWLCIERDTKRCGPAPGRRGRKR